MVGVITTRHLFTQSRVIINEFGTRCFFRCIWRALTAHPPVTFLECIGPAEHGEGARHVK
jgi:hypothetical protein